MKKIWNFDYVELKCMGTGLEEMLYICNGCSECGLTACVMTDVIRLSECHLLKRDALIPFHGPLIRRGRMSSASMAIVDDDAKTKWEDRSRAGRNAMLPVQ